nr:MAG TPA: hypothetical protein [Caudoviricetes sp.]
MIFHTKIIVRREFIALFLFYKIHLNFYRYLIYNMREGRKQNLIKVKEEFLWKK